VSVSPSAAPARLLALRLHGFKSFAERTVVEFGGGISAIVGPNGSGKSNLADALRWALGEQGRALRSRKAEDVIWAGSEKRSAQGMADVTILLDNADGLLPVDYQVLELGRRLYRSGENDYLLNKQRVRLRDLVDLLDGAHLADNAFLFIGQGMVEQALALRPEERRPLFEEVAGVRRHERRRRKAEEQLAESETNLARVEDIVAELRPQARRLAAQAEQQATRLSAGDELASALLLTAHARWHEASVRVGAVTGRRAAVQSDADRSMAELAAAEEAAAALAADLGARSTVERERRAAHETALAALTALGLRDARLAAELDAIGRDRERLAAERAAAEADLTVQRRASARPVPPRDHELEEALSEAERGLADALAELAGLRAARRAEGEELAAVRRAEAARQAELETARRRLGEAARRAAEETREVEGAAGERAMLEAALATARAKLTDLAEEERAATASREAARAELDAREGARQSVAERAAAAGSAVAQLRGRVESVQARLAEDEARGIARAARRFGGRRLDEDLVVDPGFRAAVEAALAEAARAYVVERDAIGGLAGERGMLVVPQASPEVARGGRTAARGPGSAGRLLDLVAELGGGPLVDAIRRDGEGAARSLLERAVWLPDLAACVALQPDLLAGWIAVPRDGSAVVTDQTVLLGKADAPLERRAEAERLARDLARLEAELDELRRAADEASEAAAAARAGVEEARATEGRLAGERHRAEEAERVAARRLETFLREAGWHEAQAGRLAAEAERARSAVESLEAAVATERDAGRGHQPWAAPAEDALSAWEARVAELRSRRDRLRDESTAQDAARRDAEAVHARAAATIALDEERIRRADAEGIALGERERTLRADQEAVRAERGLAVAREAAARTALDEVRAADTADRERLGEAERSAAHARERLRAADERLRAADHAELEARLGLDGLREQLLVELAGLGELGRTRLAAVSGVAPGSAEPDGEDAGGENEAVDLAALLDAAAPSWEAAPPTDEPPSPGRLATLRRRYHELGAANPYAVAEYAEVKARLDGLETQAGDLRTAITRTRELIDELNTMIADQFRGRSPRSRPRSRPGSSSSSAAARPGCH
jgi:chromosome segregation protein